ncbi:LuxE/PaaK family acyltransferase [Mesonia aquimarina]|uniref:LuxE/PaaK family acyltransferase n=1 Tax=Mesonia aquimarina TaxID=1504967 RepID=UPI000EF56272|nr:acyl transferase [Mesonia aquimarina]
MEIDSIFSISNPQAFEKKALEIFQFQYQQNSVYHQFCELIKCNPSKVDRLEKIPFLPIEFFKTHQIVSSAKKTEQIFTSSGTTGSVTSKHYVSDISVYEKSFRTAFYHFYGAIEDYVVLALLPSYLERSGSSLIYMAQDFIESSKHPESGFYLNELDELAKKLIRLDAEGKKILLIGVSFGLLDLIEKHQFHLKNTIVMETGGMKGRRKEMIRKELHEHLANGFGVKKIHSEYGMTELLSQAYSKGNGIFSCPPQMKILIRDPEDPLTLLGEQKNGGINIIDLANVNSCSFIATQDLGKKIGPNRFEILGRFDHSDVRGCNLMAL